ncbi:MAG: hypothetical protein ACREDR_09005, partial [Blastocatellia bacterium]
SNFVKIDGSFSRARFRLGVGFLDRFCGPGAGFATEAFEFCKKSTVAFPALVWSVLAIQMLKTVIRALFRCQ